MGSCLSTVLPRSMLGARREGSPKENTSHPENKELPGEANVEELRDSVNSKHLADDEQSEPAEPLPNGVHSKHLPDEEHNKHHLEDDVHEKSKGVETKRRALLVGITYTSPFNLASNTWSQLDGPHDDVDQYRDLLISA